MKLNFIPNMASAKIHDQDHDVPGSGIHVKGALGRVFNTWNRNYHWSPTKTYAGFPK